MRTGGFASGNTSTTKGAPNGGDKGLIVRFLGLRFHLHSEFPPIREIRVYNPNCLNRVSTSFM